MWRRVQVEVWRSAKHLDHAPACACAAPGLALTEPLTHTTLGPASDAVLLGAWVWAAVQHAQAGKARCAHVTAAGCTPQEPPCLGRFQLTQQTGTKPDVNPTNSHPKAKPSVSLAADSSACPQTSIRLRFTGSVRGQMCCSC